MSKMSENNGALSNCWVAADRSSEVWKFFEQGTGTFKGKARCKTCKKVFAHCVTTTLRHHAEKVHNKIIAKLVPGVIKPPDETQPSILAKMTPNEKEDVKKVLSRLAAIDRIPFATIANSEDIKKGIKARGFKMPEGRDGIKKAG